MDALRIKCNKVERKAGRNRGTGEERQQACLDRPSGQKVGAGGQSGHTHRVPRLPAGRGSDKLLVCTAASKQGRACVNIWD